MCVCVSALYPRKQFLFKNILVGVDLVLAWEFQFCMHVLMSCFSLAFFCRLFCCCRFCFYAFSPHFVFRSMHVCTSNQCFRFLFYILVLVVLSIFTIVDFKFNAMLLVVCTFCYCIFNCRRCCCYCHCMCLAHLSKSA